MAKGSTRRRKANRQTPRSSGGPSGVGLTAEERLGKCFEEIDAVAEQAKETEREAQVAIRESGIWDENYSQEEQATGQSDAFTGSPLKCSTPHSSSVSKLFNTIAGPAETPWGVQLQNLFPEDEICPPNNASRAPLFEMTNLDVARPSHNPGVPITPPALPRSQQGTSEDKHLKQFRQYEELFYERFHPSSPLPQQDSAFAPQDSTNTTNTQETGSLVIDLDEDDFYADDVGVYYGTNGEDSDGDALSVPESLPAETPTTSSEVISPYPSEPQDSPASSPPAEVTGTQSEPSEASSLKKVQQGPATAADDTDAQPRPSEGRSAPTVAAKEQASTEKKTFSRKRRLSESEDQPNKRPASESKLQSAAVATAQASPAPAAPSPAPLPVAGVAANTPAVESAAPSRATNEGTRQREASEATTTPNPIPCRLSPCSLSGDYCFCSSTTHSSELSSTNEGVDQRSAQEATTNANPSVSSGETIQTTAPLAQPVPVNATRRRANAVAPSNVPTSASVVSSTLISSPDFEAPVPCGENQGTGKKCASIKGKGRRGANSRNQGNENGQTTIPLPLYGGMQLVWHSGNPDAVVGHAATGSAVQPSDANEKKPENGYILYRNTMFSLHWSAEKVKLEWRNMPESEKNIWCSKADLKRVEEAAKRQGNSCGQSTSSAVPSPSPGPSAQNNQAQTSVDLPPVPGPSTAPTEGSGPIQYGQVGSSSTQQEPPQAPAMPPMQQLAPDPRYQAPPNGFPATHYPTIGGNHHYPPATGNQVPPSYYHIPQVSIPFNGYPPQGMPMVPPNFWAHAGLGYGMPALPPNAAYFMNQLPATNNAHDDNANANAGPSVPLTNANNSSDPLPHGQFLGYHQAAAMNANTAAGPSMPPAANNVPWGQGLQSWAPTPWCPDYPGNEGPTGSHRT
ncbi:hypothetical protein H1R20_g7546, partial [Candolleomyces eurysporus]